MHQDQRIGLALGVLLIGACAALFFRNETVDVSNSPRLQHAQELDDRIAERSTRPYLKGIEVVESADRARMRTVADRQAEDVDEDHTPGFWSPADSIGGKKSAGQRKPRARLSDIDSDVEELDPIAIPSDHPNHPEKTRKDESSTPSVVTSRMSDSASNEGPTHVVQKGETLSSIAAKRLGNPSRFRELFEANQDQLNDVNDLKSGMTLRIPQTESQSKPLASKARSTNAVEVELDNQSFTDTELESPDRKPKAASTGHNESPSNRKPSLRTTQPSSEYPDDKTTPARKFLPSRRFLTPNRPQARTNELSDEHTNG